MLEGYEPGIKSLSLIPSRGGAFEVIVNGRVIFSKLQLKRHAEPGEVKALLRKQIEEGF
ncbi:MAG: Rdx family protein [Anaerolineaceae bacterium]|nr:Rdx family protein [Anaerolineaceae bacterium]